MCINTFRGITVNGDWVYGNLNILENERPDGIAAGYYISSSDGRFPFAYAVRPETIGQFTDVYDENGVKIYDGDLALVTYDNGSVDQELHLTQVEWDNGGFMVGRTVGEGYELWLPIFTEKDPYGYRPYLINVVGNIYENPDLKGVSD